MRHSSGTAKGLFRVRWRGQITGPYALDRIVQMVRVGELSRHHEISADGNNWKTLEKSGFMGQPVSLHRPTGSPPETCQDADRSREMNGATVARQSARVPFDSVAGMPPSLIQAGDPTGRHAASVFGANFPVSAKRGLALVVIGVAPLAISFIQMLLGLSFAQVAWLFSTYFCVMWGWIIGMLADWRLDLWKKGIMCSLFTCFIGIAMLLIWQNIPLVSDVYSGLESENPAMRLAGYIFGVGLLEELCKSAPLLLFCLGPGIIRTRGDGLLLGMLSGFGFAVNEGVEYTMRYWSVAVGMGAESIQQCVEAASSWSGVVDQQVFTERLEELLPHLFEQYGGLVSAQLIRFMTLPLLHAAWAALVGYSIALSLIRRSWGIMWAGLGVAALLHGFYNFFSNSVYGVFMAGGSLIIPILLYSRGNMHAGKERYG